MIYIMFSIVAISFSLNNSDTSYLKLSSSPDTHILHHMEAMEETLKAVAYS